jgi:hypothetical protein
MRNFTVSSFARKNLTISIMLILGEAARLLLFRYHHQIMEVYFLELSTTMVEDKH